MRGRDAAIIHLTHSGIWKANEEQGEAKEKETRRRPNGENQRETKKKGQPTATKMEDRIGKTKEPKGNIWVDGRPKRKAKNPKRTANIDFVLQEGQEKHGLSGHRIFFGDSSLRVRSGWWGRRCSKSTVPLSSGFLLDSFCRLEWHTPKTCASTGPV